MKRDYPERPMVGVGAIILRQADTRQVVLVKRRNPPFQGEWTVPGGLLELGEALEAGAVREAREETGLEVHPTQAVEVFDRIVRDQSGRVEYHYVLLDYVCEVVSGELRAGGDAVDARWFGEAELGVAGVSEFTAGVVRRAMDNL